MHLELSRQSLSNALDQLESLGMISAIGDGQRVVYERTDHPGWKVFAEMIRTFEDPAGVLRDLLRSVPGIQAAFLFGSVAKSTARPDSDVDLFILGDGVDASSLGEAIMEAEITLGRPVDVKRFTPEKLQSSLQRKGTSYLKRVLDGPKRWVIGSAAALPLAA
ncbi:MAG: nucleotidyltransferase domain-containing protein [Gemmatimonadota bacterium]